MERGNMMRGKFIVRLNSPGGTIPAGSSHDTAWTYNTFKSMANLFPRKKKKEIQKIKRFEMKRETGYYHVKRIPDAEGYTEWEIAYYEVLDDRNVWTLIWFNDLEFQDSAFCEINETRIKNPDEQ